MPLELQDTLYTLLHLIIIGFNLLGWIWRPARRAHLVLVTLTALSWFVLGLWYGMGYCPITDWQWNVKQKLGEQNLPNSFIKYLADRITGADINATLVDGVTVTCFFLVFVIALYLEYTRRRQRKNTLA